MKKFLSVISIFLILLFLFPIFIPVSAEMSISAQSACLIEAESGKAIYSKNADKKMNMASTTKVMTAIIAIESGISLDTIFKTPVEAVGVEGSSVYLAENEKITFEALLYSLLLASANDAAVAIAIQVAGSVEAFVNLMNAKAQELGLSNTHFTNPHGLYDEEHYTTAHDLARLMAYAMKNEIFATITASQRKVFAREGEGVRVLINHNKLLKTYDGVIGGKTGFTKKSGRCLISVAERDGLRLIAVTLNAPDDWRDHATLYDFGFDNYEIRKIPPTNLSLPVISGKKDTINLTSSELSIFISKNANIITKVEIPRWIFAPVHEGEKIGNVVYYLNGKKVASSPIIATEAIEQVQPKFNFFDWLFNILKGLTKWNK
jgi:D-alanyl-D-alanine carboxypeptidase